MKSVNAAIFDIGNVLVKFDYQIAASRLMAKNRLAELPDRMKIVRAKEQLEGGLIDTAAFLQVVRPLFSDDGDEAAFIRIWQDIFEPNEPIVAIVRDLKGRLPLYLLSNISEVHQTYLFETYPFFALFDRAVFSYRAMTMKPGREIFQIATRDFEVEPSRTLFIDDTIANIETAASMGFQTHHYQAGADEAARAALFSPAFAGPI